MLNIGWSEMLIVAAIALIVVGPKDLPVMLRQLGRVFGTVRRMGNEFKTEISKVAALDEVKDIKNSITAPLKETHEELTSQFNSIGKDGVEPSGAIAPKIDGQESVADEIREAAGLPPVPQPDPKAAASSMKAAISRAQSNAAPASKTATAKKAVAKKTTARKPAVKKTAAPKKTAVAKKTTAKAAAAKPAAKTTAAKKPVARKPRVAAKTATAAKPKASAAKAKPATSKPAASKTTTKTRRAPAKKPAAPKGNA